jgi:hypothetical protein
MSSLDVVGRQFLILERRLCGLGIFLGLMGVLIFDGLGMELQSIALATFNVGYIVAVEMQIDYIDAIGLFIFGTRPG